MIDNKKEQEREELHRTIWNMANDPRGSVDGWDFKQYVLGMLFYRYISENFVRYVNAGEIEAGNANFDYANLADSDAEPAREELVDTKGYFILPSELFCNVRKKAPQDENLNETLRYSVMASMRRRMMILWLMKIPRIQTDWIKVHGISWKVLLTIIIGCFPLLTIPQATSSKTIIKMYRLE